MHLNFQIPHHQPLTPPFNPQNKIIKSLISSIDFSSKINYEMKIS